MTSLLLPLAYLMAAEPLDLRAIVDKANKALRGDSSHVAMEMSIITPRWSRTLDIEAWTRGRQEALILIHDPPRDRGNATLRRQNEMWLWMPRVERVMKIAPMMMHSSWQGSDFTYEDIVKADSIVKDYDHSLLERVAMADRERLKILAVPKPEAPVVWGKVLLWCDLYPDGGVVPVAEEDYNERGERVRSIRLSEVQSIGGVRVPTRLECLPDRKPGQKTDIHYKRIEFDVPLEDRFFSLSRLQRSS